jgi:hypothetical protein
MLKMEPQKRLGADLRARKFTHVQEEANFEAWYTKYTITA